MTGKEKRITGTFRVPVVGEHNGDAQYSSYVNRKKKKGTQLN
jgi:hypothetical protein